MPQATAGSPELVSASRLRLTGAAVGCFSCLAQVISNHMCGPGRGGALPTWAPRDSLLMNVIATAVNARKYDAVVPVFGSEPHRCLIKNPCSCQMSLPALLTGTLGTVKMHAVTKMNVVMKE